MHEANKTIFMKSAQLVQSVANKQTKPGNLKIILVSFFFFFYKKKYIKIKLSLIRKSTQIAPYTVFDPSLI